MSTPIDNSPDRRQLVAMATASAMLAGVVPSPAAAAARNLKILRTPEEAFDGVAFPFQKRFTRVWVRELGEVRITHYVAGPVRGEPIILMHGNPSWAYLYRDMIPIFARAGYRVYAPDLLGLGRSDKVKPQFQDLYTYAAIEQAMRRWLDKQGIGRANLFVQDWGGLIGLRLFAERPRSFRRVIASNTALPSGAANEQGLISPEFLQWRQASQVPSIIPTPSVSLQGGTATTLTPDQLAAYDAPYPDESYLVALRKLAALVPITPEQEGARRNARLQANLSNATTPFLTLFGTLDPFTAGWDAFFQDLIPGAKGQPHERLPGVAHFSQDDAGIALAEKSIRWMRSTPAG